MKPQLKQFGDLTPIDFDEHPVWVNCHVVDYDASWYEDTDEETFRPWTGPLPVIPDTMYLVATVFRLADGLALRGFATPKPYDDEPLPRSLGSMQPQLFTSSGERVAFWLGMFPSGESIESAYRALAKRRHEVFPIDFNALPGLTSGVCQGQIPGFCSMPTGIDSVVKVEQ